MLQKPMGMIDHQLALQSIFAISLGLLIEEIMLSAIFHVLLGAGTTVAAIAIAFVGLSAGGLFAFLLSSGLGRAFSHRIKDIRLEQSVHITVFAVLAIGLGFASGSATLVEATIAQPLTVRIGIAIGAIFPLAFAMGIFFPLGVRMIARENEKLIPWAWAINGCFSVLGIFGARITALFLGFSRALLLGLAIYALVSGCVYLNTRTARRE